MEAGSTHSDPRTVEEIFQDYSGRRLAIILALTHDVNKFLEECDPVKDDLCLYGYPDETWKLEFPTKTVPSSIPEPTTGINFVRDIGNRKAWLFMVSIHSDCWLLAVAFFFAAPLHSNERRRLFILMNSLSSVYEVLREYPYESYISGESSGSTSRGNRKRSSGSGGQHQHANTSSRVEGSKEDETPCGMCGGRYIYGQEFWIACETCETWFHGRCVLITPSMAEHIDKYECPECVPKRIRQQAPPIESMSEPTPSNLLGKD